MPPIAATVVGCLLFSTTGLTAPASAAVVAVGMPASGSCADIDEHQPAWGGEVHGGWHATWHQWANNGRGGPVCSRTLVNANGRWIAQ